jgi:hypothetical protein
MQLLPVREAKKEQPAYKAQMRNGAESETDDGDDLGATA